MADAVPEPVRQFIAATIDSVSLLDVLLLMRAAGDRVWTPAEAARALVSSEHIAAGHFEQLCASGLAAREAEAFRYAPGERAEVVDQLAECYVHRRHTVIALIYGADARRATTLADAFSLRRRKS